jgi:hypothetical protein
MIPVNGTARVNGNFFKSVEEVPIASIFLIVLDVAVLKSLPETD